MSRKSDFARRVRRATAARAVALVAMTIASLGATASPTGAATLSLEQWAAGYLSYLGAPAKGPSDARVVFLEKWATVEATFYLGNTFNPLDTELSEPGAGLWNSAGVRTFPTLALGYKATLATMQQRYDAPILAGLRNLSSTVASLTKALAESNWSGYGQSSSYESGYASVIGKGPVGPAGPEGPSRQAVVHSGSSDTLKVPKGGAGSLAPAVVPPSATIRGTIVDPLGHPLGGVCVEASAAGVDRYTGTASSGTFSLSDLPQSGAHLKVTDCHGAAGGVRPAFFSATGGRHRTTPFARQASSINLRCPGGKSCLVASVNLRRPIVYGIATPAVTWETPPSMPYGTPLGASALDASASVAGSFAYAPALGTVLTAGSQHLNVTFTPTDKAEFKVVHQTVTVSIGRVAPTVSWPKPAGITYGTALSGTQLAASASVPGIVAYRSGSTAGTVLGAGNHTLSATFTPTDSTDFSPVVATTTITVAQASPTVTVLPSPTALPGTKLTASDVNAKASTSGAFAYNPPIGTVLGAGSIPVTVTFTPYDTVDYQSTSQSVMLNAPTTTPTVTWATPTAVAAGAALSSTQLDAKSSVAGTFRYTPASGTIVAAGTTTLSVTFTPTNTLAYTPVTMSVPLVVKPPIVPTITWSTPSAVPAGTALTATQLAARSSVLGIFTYSPALGVVLPPGNNTLSVTFTPTNAIAYAPATATVTLVVRPLVVPTVTWATPGAVAAGAALSAAQLNAHASVTGTFAYSPPLGTVMAGGSHTLSATFTPANPAAYASVTTTVSLLVAAAVVPTITWTTPTSIASGTALSATQLNAHASAPGTFTYSAPAGTVLTATTSVTVTFTPTDAVTYQSANATVTITVT